MKTKSIARKIIGVILIAFAGHAGAAVTSETRQIAHDANAIFLWAVDPSDMTFNAAASDFSGLAGWNLDTNPIHATSANSAWVLTGPAVSASDSVTLDIGFDYKVGGFLGASFFQYQYAVVLFNGTQATVQRDGARTLVRSSLVNSGVSIGPALSIAQYDAIDSYFATMPGPATVPIPSSILLMSAGLSFLGFRHRAQKTKADSTTG